MVKCACGREFKNMGKLMRHFVIYVSKNDKCFHVPEMGHEATREAYNRYNKSHKGRK